MNIKFIFIAVALFFSTFVLAQVPQNNSQKSVIDNNDCYEVVGDKRLSEVEMRMKKINEAKETITGYRIQLFSSSGPNSFDKANTVLSDFLAIYGQVPAYVAHRQPAFKVRVGDFRLRLDAERFFIELKEHFPDAFIVKDDIKLPIINVKFRK